MCATLDRTDGFDMAGMCLRNEDDILGVTLVYWVDIEGSNTCATDFEGRAAVWRSGSPGEIRT